MYYQDFLSSARFAGFQVAGGAVAFSSSKISDPEPYKAGHARGSILGTYTGALDADYLVEIHVCPDGTFANSRWRWSDTGGATWNQQNLVPQNGMPITLNNGVQWQFDAAGLTPEFVQNDFWFFRGIEPYGIAKALDGSRESDYRSGTMPASSTLRIGFDLGSSQQPGFVVVDDHNLPSNATVTLFAHPTTLFTETGGFSQVLTWRLNRLNEFITSAAFRFWWLRIVLAGSALTFLRLSELFLGTGFTFIQPPISGASEDDEFLASLDPGFLVRGRGPQVRKTIRRQYTWQLTQQTPTSDGGRLDVAIDFASTHTSYEQQPFYFILDDTDLSKIQMNNWVGDGIQRRNRFRDRWDYSVQWTELIRRLALS